jgi:hypothetical protein
LLYIYIYQGTFDVDVPDVPEIIGFRKAEDLLNKSKTSLIVIALRFL